MTFSSVNTIWVLLGAALVFFMQAGFSMCEAGLLAKGYWVSTVLPLWAYIRKECSPSS